MLKTSPLFVSKNNIYVFGGSGEGMTVDIEAQRYAYFDDGQIKYKTKYVEVELRNGGTGYKKGERVFSSRRIWRTY